ncbi:MAG: hypothetical protein JWO05_1817 [Gemmatimonadetes bacterium]|nr:hypothetical protein [Gemmatimonadota bacterium]
MLPTMLLALALSLTQQPGARGTVFLDRNANRTQDAGEPGIGGVAVSNQDAVTVTGADGAYALPPGGHGVVFVSVPDGYRSTGSFWRVSSDTAPVSFGLAAIPRAREFTFVHASDTHLSPASLARTQRLRAMTDSIHPAFVLITGDLVKDALRVGEAEATSYYQLFAKERAAFASPVFTVPGNHENFAIERMHSLVSAKHPLFGRAMYRHWFGPDYYSFTHGGVHFVGLNTVDIDDLWYYGHVDSLQLAWLERDLALVPPSMPVVTFDHIPFYSVAVSLSGFTDEPPAPTLITVKGKTDFRHVVSNAGDVLAVLRRRRHVLALGGHIHQVERFDFEQDGQPLRFATSAATVGPSEVNGVTYPSGFTVYTVRDGVIDAGRFVRLDPPPR